MYLQVALIDFKIIGSNFRNQNFKREIAESLLIRDTRSSLNPLTANPTKWPNTLKQFVAKLLTNFLSVFDHFVKLALKDLTRKTCQLY